MPDLASSVLPLLDRPLTTQVFNPDTGETWADFFTDRAIRNMSELVGYYNASIAAGFVLDAEQRERIDNAIASVLMEADYYSSVYPQAYATPASYLQALYGASMNENTMRGLIEFIFTGIAFNEHIRDSFYYSDETLEAFYIENRNDFDIFRYRLMLIHPEPVYQADFDSPDEFMSAQEEALSDSRGIAASIAMGIVSEEDFITEARIYDEETFGDRDSTLVEHMGEWKDADFAPWLGEASRRYGDVGTVESEDGTFIVFFIERDGNDYLTTSMRQILLMREQVYPDFYMEGEDDPEFLESFENADMEARARAEEVLELFVLGGSTEDALIELMEEYSDDDSEGGFYDKIARFHFQDQDGRLVAMRVVREIEDWLFDKGRAIGDSQLVHTEAFGYHLLYFMGHNERFRDIISSDRIRQRDFLEWKDGLPDEVVAKHWIFALTKN